jgi:hypothetical protein
MKGEWRVSMAFELEVMEKGKRRMYFCCSASFDFVQILAEEIEWWMTRVVKRVTFLSFSIRHDPRSCNILSSTLLCVVSLCMLYSRTGKDHRSAHTHTHFLSLLNGPSSKEGVKAGRFFTSETRELVRDWMEIPRGCLASFELRVGLCTHTFVDF